MLVFSFGSAVQFWSESPIHPRFGLHSGMILGSDLDWIPFGQNNPRDALQECAWYTPTTSNPSVFEIKTES